MNPSPKTYPGLLHEDPTYATRDDIARSHQPGDALERMLVTAAAQAWGRLQVASAVHAKISETTAPSELFLNNLAGFKILAGYVADAERSWHQALNQLHKSQRIRANKSSIPRDRILLRDPSARGSHP
jgi:Flp pilus assembly protein TadD